MNIAFDATAIFAKSSENEELSNFVCNQLRKLMEYDKENNYFLFNMYGQLDDDWSRKYQNFKEYHCYSGYKKEVLRFEEYKSILGNVVRNFLKEFEIDVFIITSPFDCDNTVYEKDWFDSTYTMALVYDIAPYKFKDKYFTSYSVQKKYIEQAVMLKRCNKCLVISDSVKEDVISYLNLDEGKVAVASDEKQMFFALTQLPENQLVSKQKKNIAMFTPLPPMKSGISDYSVDIISEISQYFDIDVFIDNGYDANCELPENVNIYKHYEFVALQDKYDEIIYQMGNSEFHIYMIDYIKAFEGIVVLHDYNLHGLVRSMCGECKGDGYSRYRQMLLEDINEYEADMYLHRYLGDVSNGGISDLELNGFVTNYAKKVIVHSNYAKEKLVDKKPCKIVNVVPLYSKIEDNAMVNQKSVGVTFAAFGIITKTKRILQIIKAFKLIVEERKDVKLVLVGEPVSNFEGTCNELISRLNLSEHIAVTGYVNLEQFGKYMDDTDVCLNLRFPYRGENSAAFARLLGKGKCTIVNDIGSFSETPDDACIKIPSAEYMTESEEVKCIYVAMKNALDEEARKRIERNAYNYAKENLGLERVGKLYADVICNDCAVNYSEAEIKRYLKNVALCI